MSHLYEFLQNGVTVVDNSKIIEQFVSFIETHWNSDKYSNVYVSFGSKYNSREQTFEYPQCIANRPYATNASFQMVPEYLRKPTEKHNLVIIVDIFSNPELLENNRHILRGLVGSTQEQSPAIDIVILDCELIGRTLTDIIQCIVKKAAQFGLTDTQCIFCNYIRYSRPNAIEQRIEEIVPTTIQRILDKSVDGQYAKSFYQWYGYLYYVYNLVYNYKLYNLKWSMQYRQLMQMFSRTLKDEQMFIHTLFLIEMGLDEYGHNGRLAWNEFCKCSFDICADAADGRNKMYPLSK